MKEKDSTKQEKATKTPKNAEKVKVLYQNLGGQWYAFAEKYGELFFSKVPLEVSALNEDEKKEFEEEFLKEGHTNG